MLVALLDVTARTAGAQVLDQHGQVLAAADRPAGDDLVAASRRALEEAAAAAPDGEWLGLMVLAPQGAREQGGRVLTLHDELVAHVTGVLAMPLPYAAATGLLDEASRCWDPDRLRRSGSRVPPLVESGTVIGEVGADWGVPASLPVVAGAPRDQLLALAAGASAAGVSVQLPDARLLVTDDPWSAQPGQVLAPYALPGLWSLSGSGTAEPTAGRVVPADVPLTVAVAALVARAVGAHAHLPHPRRQD